jgi:predicted membrane chloride channel (bestrophin family)
VEQETVMELTRCSLCIICYYLLLLFHSVFSEWLHNTISLPNSAILRSIRFPVVFMTSWATFLSFVHRKLLEVNPQAASAMCLASAPHALMVSSLSLLLVFKTNSAYQRFAEGRVIWEGIINGSRDLYRMMTLYESEIGRTKRRRLQRLLAAFPYLLRHRIRPNLVMYRMDDENNVRNPEHSIVLYQDKAADDLDPEAAAVATQEESEGKSRRKRRTLYWVDKRTLPWRLLPQDAIEACARAQNRPLWVCDRMATELKNVPDGPNFSARERLALISKVEKLSACIGACERIHQTGVPLNYARHSLRALTLWLFTLPFSLVESLRMVTGPVLFLVSWLLFGVYEIGYSIEDPFQGTLRLSVLCDTIRRDVLAHEVFRSTAFDVKSDVGGGSGGDVSAKKETDDDDDDSYESSRVPVEIDYSTIAQVVEELPTIPIQSNADNEATWVMATDSSGTVLFNKTPMNKTPLNKTP